METNACYRDVESCRYHNVKSHLFSLIISKNMLFEIIRLNKKMQDMYLKYMYLKYMSCIFLSLYHTLRGNCSA